jgi:hypothetical protein
LLIFPVRLLRVFLRRTAHFTDFDLVIIRRVLTLSVAEESSLSEDLSFVSLLLEALTTDQVAPFSTFAAALVAFLAFLLRRERDDFFFFVASAESA